MSASAEFFQQYAALGEGAGVADLSERTRLEIGGADRVAFLHAFCTNDVKRLAAGSGCEAFITSPQGKTLGHVLIFCEPERLVIDTSPSQAATLVAHFNKYVITEEVEFIDRTAETGKLLVAGGEAGRLLERVSGGTLPMELLSHKRGCIGHVAVFVARVEYAGPVGFFVHAERRRLAEVKEALDAAGGLLCGEQAVEARRLEAGFPLFGRDITDANLPQEVGRDAKAISFTKGCYLGQETVARIDALGHVNRLLVGLRFSSDQPPPAGTPVLAGEKEAGVVTSSAWSPLVGAPLAMGYVRRSLARAGTVLASPVGPAEVIALPVGQW